MLATVLVARAAAAEDTAKGPLAALVEESDPHAAVTRVVKEAGARALPILEALDDGRLSRDAAGRYYIADEGGALHRALDGAPAPPSLDVTAVTADNALRREIAGAVAELRLSS